MRAVEALSIATKYFSRFPNAALSFATQAADEARHVAALTVRVIELEGTLSPSVTRSELLELLPGFKVDAQGDIEAMVRFVSQLCAVQHAKLQFSEEFVRLLEGEELTQRVVGRIAKDERLHLTAIVTLLDSITSQGGESQDSGLLVSNEQSAISTG
jgi:hypothetical protein